METNKDLLIKNNPADLILLAIALRYDGSENSVTLLINSAEGWLPPINDKDSKSILGYWGTMLLLWFQMDLEIKGLIIEYYQVVNGESKDLAKYKPIYRDGKKYKRATVNRDGSITFSKDDEI